MTADLIIHNAKIYTVDQRQPWAEAVACGHGRILAVGTNADILSLAGPQTQQLDAGGRLILPGLIDAHVHFLQYIIRQRQVNLFGLRRFEEVRRRLAEAVTQTAPGRWIQGWGWDETMWDVQPDTNWLDQLAPQNPVALARLDMHTWWVNQVALQQAGITRFTKDPAESRIERDETGQPTGLLREWNAIALVEKHISLPEDAVLESWLREGISQAHQLGLTGIHDQRVEQEGRRSFRLYHVLDRQGELKLRVHFNLAVDYAPEIARLGLRPGFGNERLWLGHLKGFADGTLGSRTAWMLEAFEGEADNFGLVVTSAQEFGELAHLAARAGFSLSIHAIGDRAVRDTIDVLAEFPVDVTSTGRLAHRIEHVQVIHPDDLPRLGQHGLVASMQPVHVMLDWQTANRNWGRRARYAYAFRSLLDHGAALAFGSDAPVAPLNPLLGLYAAVTRQDERGKPRGGWYPEERITLAEAIAGYTIGPAQLSGKQHLQGSITAGKWADLIGLERNLFEIQPEEIPETRVNLTVFNGEIVYGPK